MAEYKPPHDRRVSLFHISDLDHTDTNTNMNDRSTICIMADFGNGPYAWLRTPENSAPHVGPCIADVTWGLNIEFGVSKELDKLFADWVTVFANNYDKKSFDWNAWEERGIDLARRLKKQVGDIYAVEYHYPFEDPTAPDPPPIILIE